MSLTTLLESFRFDEPNLLGSVVWLRIANVLCATGVLAAFVAGWQHWRMPAGDVRRKAPAKRLAVALLYGALVTTFVSIWHKGVEVNHFPSQTMAEVLVMFGFSLLVSLTVLHHVLKLAERGPRWGILDDSLFVLTLSGAWLTNVYSSTLVTAQRDLPPALQSYWFPPHLAALIFSYATLGIAGLICVVYFATRFWSGVFSGGRSRASQLLVLGLLLLVPFVHFVTAPVLVLCGLVFLWLKATGRLPGPERLGAMERDLDQVSYKAFSVGFPFLTAGLFMGAFWAQEAWANYWGWDSKENSALITWLIYVAYIHLRMLGGYRGEKAMGVLMGGALSIFLTFQVFGYLPDSQKSLHRYTDDGVTAQEGLQGGPAETESARVTAAADEG